MKAEEKIKRCAVCGATEVSTVLVPLGSIRPNLAEELRAMSPQLRDSDYICTPDVQRARTQHVERLLQDERGELTSLEKDVLSALSDHELLAEHPQLPDGEGLSLGERLSDKLAGFGGSWRFILLFGSVLAVWIAFNSLLLLSTPFDPYPFILLNLVLSCLAAIQAPVIMMSQNRQEAKDRQRAEYDYRINLKAELEIRHLHEKVDHLLKHQWERLVEIQRIQIEILSELMRKTHTTK
jgi:uncharacterized membrane protein